MNQEHFQSLRTPFLLLLLLVLLDGFFTYSLILTNFYELKTSGVDGKSFEQVIFNFINGNGLTSTIAPPYIKQSWLGVHFSPILYAIAPLYWLFPNLETLLFLQSFCVAIAAIPIFFAARIITRSNWQPLTIAAFYLATPFVINAQIWDFHEIAFAPLTLSLILWAIAAKKRNLFIISCLILLLVKEHYGLAVFGSGILWAWHWREYKFGISAAVLGLLAFFVTITVIMPQINPTGAAAMMSANSHINHFGWLLSPLENFSLLTSKLVDAITYFTLLMSLFVWQPVFSFMWLLPALADFTINTASSNNMLLHPSAYHSAAIIPVLLIAYTKTIAGLYNDNSRIRRGTIILATAIMVMVFFYRLSSLPYLPNNIWEFSTHKFSLSASDAAATDRIQQIIGDASISAQSNILPHIKVRSEMYLFPNNLDKADYVLLKLSIPFYLRSNVFSIPYYNEYTDIYFSSLYRMLDDKNFSIVFYEDNWLLFKRGAQAKNSLTNKVKTDIENLITKIESLDKRRININYHAIP